LRTTLQVHNDVPCIWGFINLKLEYFLQQVFGTVAGELALSNIRIYLGIWDKAFIFEKTKKKLTKTFEKNVWFPLSPI